jgi:hypothetical protein
LPAVGQDTASNEENDDLHTHVVTSSPVTGVEDSESQATGDVFSHGPSDSVSPVKTSLGNLCDLEIGSFPVGHDEWSCQFEYQYYSITVRP